MVLDKELLVIVGAPKSGTTWLQIMIGAHPLVCTTVELTLYSRYTAPWIKAWNQEAANISEGRWHQGLPFLWTQDEFYGFLREFLGKVYERVLTIKPQATHVLDKHPGYSAYVEDIKGLVPNARFIHMIRDGRDVAVSMIAAKAQIGYGARTIEEGAAAWRYHVEQARKARQYRDQYLEVRYEDLSTAGVDTLKSVFDFCGLQSSVEEIASIVEVHQFERMKARRQHANSRAQTHEAFYRKGKVGSWQEELGPIERYAFDRIAGNLLLELGYARDGWWAESRSQKLMLPLVAAVSTGLRRGQRASRALLAPLLSTYLRNTQKQP